MSVRACTPPRATSAHPRTRSGGEPCGPPDRPDPTRGHPTWTRSFPGRPLRIVSDIRYEQVNEISAMTMT
jgi:hypothetical protein